MMFNKYLCRRGRIRGRVYLVALVVIVVLLFVKMIDIQRLFQWKSQRHSLIERYNKERKSFVNTNTVCSVPNLNPFSKEVVSLMRYKTESCTLKRYGRIVDGVYTVKAGSFRHAYIQYIRRAPKDGEITNDFDITLTEKIPVPRKGGVYNLYVILTLQPIKNYND